MGGVAVRNVKLRHRRVQADQHAVRPQGQAVGHLVEARGEIEHAVRVYRPLDGSRIVGGTIAYGALAAHVDPFRHRRQIADRTLTRGGEGGKPLDIRLRRIGTVLAERGNREAIGEVRNLVGRALAYHRAPALAEVRKDGGAAGKRILETDLREDVVLVRNDDAGLADVLEPHVLAPKGVAVTAIDLDPDRRVAKHDVDHGQAHFMLADGSIALPLEAGVEQGELPGGRGLLGDDAIAAAVKVDVLDDVAGLVDTGEGRTQAEVHVAEKGVLGHTEAHPGSGGIAFADLDVEIAHGRVERAGIGIAYDLVARHHRGHRHGHIAHRVLIVSGEDDHGRDTLLEARRAGGEKDGRTLLPYAIDPDPCWNHQRAGDPVSAGRQEHHAVPARVASLVERFLDCSRIVGAPVSGRLHGHGAGFVGRGGEHGGTGRLRVRQRNKGARRQQCRHPCTPSDHCRLPAGFLYCPLLMRA